MLLLRDPSFVSAAATPLDANEIKAVRTFQIVHYCILAGFTWIIHDWSMFPIVSGNLVICWFSFFFTVYLFPREVSIESVFVFFQELSTYSLLQLKYFWTGKWTFPRILFFFVSIASGFHRPVAYQWTESLLCRNYQRYYTNYKWVIKFT